MAEADARARISAQATEAQRRLVADIWLDNAGTEGELVERVRELWHQRIEPFSHNLATRSRVKAPPRLVAADPTWPDQARRILARLNTACGHRALRIDHIGSTAVRARRQDVIDIQITVASLDIADELADHLLRAGYPRAQSITADVAKTDGRSTDAAFDHTKDNRLWQSGFMHRPILGAPPISTSGWRLAEPAIRAAVPGLVERKPRRQGRLSGDQTHRGRTPRHRSVRRGEGALVPRRLSASVELGGCDGLVAGLGSRVRQQAGIDAGRKIARRVGGIGPGCRNCGCRVSAAGVSGVTPTGLISGAPHSSAP